MEAHQGPPQTPGTQNHEDAGLGRRSLAAIVDSIFFVIPVFAVATALFGETESSGGNFSASLTGVPFILTTVLVLGYFFVLELMGGQTIGKKLLGIRVVSDDGSELTAGPLVARTLLRMIDGIFFYLVGFLVALFSGKNQRLGDMAGHTRVVRSR